MSQKFKSFVALSSTLFLCACSSMNGTSTGKAGGTTATGEGQDPLLDAPNRSTMTCTSEAPVTVLRQFKDVRFACPDLGVSVTIDEMRDAGWRVLSTDIGEESEADSHIGFPVSVKVRKLF